MADALPPEAVVSALVREASRAELELVHTPGYLDGLERFCAGGGGKLDRDTPTARGSWRTALRAAGTGLATIEAVQQSPGDIGFVAMRPPGHHASAERAMGFCLINNIAVAAAALAAQGERVLIVDWDVHHGNGTQAIFWNDPRVLYVSMHQAPFYPGTGAAHETGGPAALGLTVNMPLPAGATGDVFLKCFDQVVAPVVDRFSPTWTLVSAGFDAHRADPLAELELSAGDFADLAWRVAALSARPQPMVLFLEGGYDLDALRSSVGATLAALMGTALPANTPERATCGGPGMAEVECARRVQNID